MITRIGIDGFRTFDDSALDVPPFLVLPGASDAGGSGVLETGAPLGRLTVAPRSRTSGSSRR